MRLFQALFRRKNMPHGHIWRGKNRLYKEVTGEDLSKLRNDLAIEEQNMFLLRNPYLTPEQSHGHCKALGRDEERKVRLITMKKEFRENVTIESRLGHLRHQETWD